ncbi:hypothetical protein ACROYT_G029011 [Oculina patagonica]
MLSNAFYVAFVFGALLVVDAYPERKHGHCDASYLRLGCFNDKHVRGLRPMSDMLFTDRDPSSDKFSGINVDWTNWDTYVEGVVCRCAKKAKAEGYTFFGLQYYGECWASKEFTFNIDGIADGCTSTNHEPCTYESPVCVGEDYSLFVYNLQL